MSRVDFLTQEATKDIIDRVTNVCSECYSDIKVGDTIHYDMLNYRYLCKSCQESITQEKESQKEIEEETTGGLFQILRYTQKQIDKFNRQKYINELEKVSKNLFRMYRDKNIYADNFVLKLKELKKGLDKRVEIRLDSEYHQQLKEYIIRIYRDTCLVESFSDKQFDDIREVEMSNLNRLQKLKNGVSYKKDKHKSKSKNQDWG